MTIDEEQYLVIDDSKKKKKTILIIILLLLVIGLIIFGVLYKNEFKYLGANSTMNDYAKSYLKLDGEKFCSVMPNEILKKTYESDNKCNEIMAKMFEGVKNNKTEYKSFEIKDKGEVTGKELEEIKLDLDRNYGISSKSIKRIVRYSISFTYKDKDGQNNVKVYIAKIDKKWFVVDQKKV